MKKMMVFSFNIVLVLALLAALPASAQGVQPPLTSPALGGSHPPQPEPARKDWEKPAPVQKAPSGGLSTQSIQMGASGTSYRMAGQFGITGVPYIADTTHLNTASGLFISGTDLYVAEEMGDRVLKFDLREPPLTPTFSIGHAGVPWADYDYLSHPAEAAVDPDGNIWVAMDTAVKQFDSTGFVLRTIPDINPWETGSDNYHFSKINGITFGPGGYLYLVDTGNQRIQVYDVSGFDPVYVTTIGETGVAHSDDNGFFWPVRMTVDGSNRLYVLDQSNFRVQRCESGDLTNWSCSTVFGETGVQGSDLTHLSTAGGLTIHNNGSIDELYITDGGNGRVLKCDTTSLPITCAVYVDTAAPGADFGWAADVAVDGSGKVYISDFHNHRVLVFEGAVTGTYQDTIGVAHVPYLTNLANMNRPAGTAVASDGSIYLVENSGYRLRKLNAAGAQLWSIGIPGVWGSDNAHFGNWWAGPEGNPAIDASGRVYVTDTGNNRVQIFTSAGAFYAKIGSNGTGTDFNCPAGVAIHPVSGDIYVNDKCNQRIQVFTAARAYKGTIGMTGSSGQDNWRFNNPRGVAVDKNGNVFVADSDNHRVQKCALSADGYNCSTFVGNENFISPDFGYLHPAAVVVDAAGKVLVSDEWNNRVQVFDASGAYLATISETWGLMPGDLVAPDGLAVDKNGVVYVTEPTNHRIQKFAPGYPGWRQANINGFGIKDNSGVTAMAQFGAYLYAGTTTGQIWRSSNGTAWRPVMTNGFNNSGNDWIDHMLVYGNRLYASTYNPWGNGGQLWRTSDGLNWQPVRPGSFNGPNNPEIFRMGVYGNKLYFGTWVSWISGQGAELWRCTLCDGSDWTQVETNGFGDVENQAILDIRGFGPNLYVSTLNYTTGVEVWRSQYGNPGTWTQVNDDGFNLDSFNYSASLANLGSYLYAATGHSYDGISGSQLRRCQKCDGTDWTDVAGFAPPATAGDQPGLTAFVVPGVTPQSLYLTVGVRDDYDSFGLKVYRSDNGTTWTEVATSGFGNKNNLWSYNGNAQAVFNEQFFAGTWNEVNGGQIWRAAASNQVRTFYSAAAQDGWILESGETTNVGGSLSNIDVSLILGDNNLKKQYRSILSFNTAPIPDGAVINSATLKLKQNGQVTGNPLGTLGNMQVDLRKPNFGLSSNLELADFNYAATSVNVCAIGKVPSLGWYSGVLSAVGKTNLNKAGLTQFRVFFTLDDNNNLIADTIKFFSGNSIAANWPQLIVNYSLP